MKFDMAVIEKLVKALDAAAETAKAKAKEHSLQREETLETQQLRRFARNAEYAENLRGLVETVKANRKKGPFTKPSREEVKAYAAELKWPTEDSMKWYDHFESNGWLVGGKTLMKDWKAACRTGFKNWQEKNPGAIQRTAVAQKTIDPEGWKEWLKGKGEPFTPYAFAQDFLKKDFRKEMF